MAKRRAMRPVDRFEIFKRDCFTCQYCGAKPPGVLLHVDHILPVAKGGGDESSNLVTACQDCNQGKAARLLTAVPLSLKETAERAAEMELQLMAWQTQQQERLKRREAKAWRVVHEFFGADCDSVPRDYFLSILRFIDGIGTVSVLEAVDITKCNCKHWWSEDRNFRYFCGICWNRVREKEGQ